MMSTAVPSLEETAALLKLLDDQDSAVRDALRERFAGTSGDLSHQLAALGIDLSAADRSLLGNYLAAGRRRILEEEWRVPASGLWYPSDDWDSFEHLLSLVADFLHDGVELRPSLSDQLDLLAEEATIKAGPGEEGLKDWLFAGGRFRGSEDDYYSPNNSDLCWVIANGLGNPISLALVYMLIGKRLGLEIGGCNFPGHFVARIHARGEDYLVDCFHGGEMMLLEEVKRRQGATTAHLKEALELPASFAQILRRVLHNLCFAYTRSANEEDAMLFNRLASSLEV